VISSQQPISVWDFTVDIRPIGPEY